MFWGILGTFNFGSKEGANNFGRVVRGANEIGRVIRGAERNRTIDIFGFLRGQMVCCVKMRRK